MADMDCEMLAEYAAMGVMEPIPLEVVERELVMEDVVEIHERQEESPAVRGLDPMFHHFCMWGNEVSLNISQIKKLKKIVKIKKLATKDNKMFVYTMKKTLVNYRMSFSRQFINDYVSNHLYGQEGTKIFIQHQWYNLEVFLKRTKDGREIIHWHWPKVVRTLNITQGSI
ncbi:Casein kinase I isoform delta-like protein [Hordeum vulgare]|nr:Casein kinase I isoform delta-like protein [Hordeum vulgare]